MVKCSHLCKFIRVVEVGRVLSQDRVEFAHCPFRMSQAYDLFSLCRAPGSIILLPASTYVGSSPRSSCPRAYHSLCPAILHVHMSNYVQKLQLNSIE